MMLYHCPTCGHWQDVSFQAALDSAIARLLATLLAQQPPEEPMYPCPAGHGLMIEVKPEDRIAVRSAVVEATEEPIDPDTAITAFVGWLTSRSEVSGPFSSHHEAGDAVKLLKAFCDAQGWCAPNERFHRQSRLLKEKYPKVSNAQTEEKRMSEQEIEMPTFNAADIHTLMDLTGVRGINPGSELLGYFNRLSDLHNRLMALWSKLLPGQEVICVVREEKDELTENMNKNIILCVGLPGSGKTTWAKRQMEAYPDFYKRINRDELRAMIDNGKYTPEDERSIKRVELMLAKLYLSIGYRVIVDDTNLSDSAQAMWRECANKNDALLEIKDFTDVSIETCIERDSQRSNPVGEQEIHRMWEGRSKRGWHS